MGVYGVGWGYGDVVLDKDYGELCGTLAGGGRVRWVDFDCRYITEHYCLPLMMTGQL